eukprot:9546523-Alexandrium_andersonii.AAC.1
MFDCSRVTLTRSLSDETGGRRMLDCPREFPECLTAFGNSKVTLTCSLSDEAGGFRMLGCPRSAGLKLEDECTRACIRAFSARKS